MYKNEFIDRRRFPRLECSIPVEYKRIGVLDSDTTRALTKNVSEDGARVITEEFVPANSRLVLILSLPFARQKVKSLCRVVWTEKFITLSRYDLGIEFIDMTSNGRRNLAIFIKSKLA